MELSIAKYLKRIGVETAIAPNKKNLFKLQQAHLQTVPYETCEIFIDKKIPSLSKELLYDKIVNKHRGGYCFELNGIFAYLLKSLGYNLTETFARWHFQESDLIPPHKHRIILVNLGKEIYIADVGIGCQCPHTPLQLKYNVVQPRNGIKFKIIKDDKLGNIVQIKTKDGYKNYYSFWTNPFFANDFVYVNTYCSTSADCIFTQKLFVHLPHPEGRRSISDETGANGAPKRILRIEKNGKVMQKEIEGCAQLKNVLKKYFSIRL